MAFLEVKHYVHEESILKIKPEQLSFAELCMNDSRRASFTRKSYTSGACIHEEGEEILQFGIVTGGVLKAVSYSRDGDERCHAYFEEGDSFPEFLYLSGKRRYTYDMYAEKRSEVLWIPIPVLEEMLSQNPGLVRALLTYVSRRGLKDQLYLNCLSYQTIRERIAYWIVGIQKIESQGEVRMPRSQKIFANMLHVSRSSLNQELKQMEREGYFRIEKEVMKEIDEERLGLCCS